MERPVSVTSATKSAAHPHAIIPPLHKPNQYSQSCSPNYGLHLDNTYDHLPTSSFVLRPSSSFRRPSSVFRPPMPLRLKHLELQGYKTFATKTEFVFGAGVSAIVGPNGSGKSNIVDSIRWVVREQYFGVPRGKKTEDMIFAGSEQRPRAGMAQATLTFDNSDGWLPIDFAEVSIARRAYRDGENEYLLNGQRVRLRDVSELLAKCGPAERNYTIIGQGLIDTALSLKAEERRALFEEAAGIGVYRNKREDALKKLDTPQRNL